MLKVLRRILTLIPEKIHFLLIFCLLLNFSAVYAEGSKDLYPAGVEGNRAYLYSNSAISGLPTGVTKSFPFRTLGTHYVYAKKGEVITFASSAQGLGRGSVEITSPTGNIFSRVALGRIGNRAQELAGPLLQGEVNSAKYAPGTQVVPDTEEGIWRIDFLPTARATSTNNHEVDNRSANGPWVQDADTEYIAAWDVSVQDPVKKEWIPGRVYTNVLNLKIYPDFSNRNKAYFGVNYVLTKDGRAYRVKNNGNNGYAFTFFSNNKGFIDGSGQALYKSLNTSDESTIRNSVHSPTKADDDVKNLITHKLFYGPPGKDLPVSATIYSEDIGQTQTWLKNAAVVPLVTDINFVGSEGTPGQSSQKGGTIFFTANVPGTYRIAIPIASGKERVISGAAVGGLNKIIWDGKDGDGQLVPGGQVIPEIKVRLASAEVHFPFIDMEINPNGIIIELAENDWPYRILQGSTDESVYSDRVYWNDNDISSGMLGEGSSPIDNRIDGSSSNSNKGHNWGTYSNNVNSSTSSTNGGKGTNSYGNERAMDTYAYILSNEEAKLLNINVRVADLQLVNISPSVNGFLANGKVTYSVKVRNANGNDVKGAKFAFKAPNNFSIESVVVTSSCADINNVQLSRTETSYDSSLDLRKDCEAVYSITGTALSGLINTSIAIEASIMRPNDVTDPDATNTVFDLVPTGPHEECKNGTTSESCNNIKYNDVIVREVCSNSLIEPIDYILASGGTEVEIIGLPAGLTFSYVGGKVVIDTPPTASGEYTFTIGTKGNDTRKTTVFLTVHPRGLRSDIIATDQTICLGDKVTLSASSSISPAEFTWYRDALLQDRLFSGADYEVSPTVNTTYYVTVKNTTTCENTPAEAKEVKVTVHPRGLRSDIIAADHTICLGEQVTLSASSSISPAEFTWYSDALLQNRLGSGATYQVSPTVNSTYYVTVKNATTCENAPAEVKEVKVTVHPRGLRSDIIAADQTICVGDKVTLSASSNISPAEFTWYSDALLQDRLFSGADYEVSPAASTTYYVTVKNASTCENTPAEVKEVKVTVRPRGLKSDIIAVDQTICLGDKVTLSASSSISTAEFTWYSDALLQDRLFSGADYEVSPTVNSTYYVTVKNAATCENTPAEVKEVKVTVNPLPQIPVITALQTTFCEGGNTILTSSSLTGNQWYKDGALIPNATAKTYSATESGTYTLTVTSTSGCTSPISLPVAVTEVPYPVTPGISPSNTTTFCEGGTVTLTSTSSFGNQWYKNGILIPNATNPTYDVNTIGVYTVKVTNTAGCTSPVSSSTTVTVTPVPRGFDDQLSPLTCTQSSFTYQLQNNIDNRLKGGNGVPSSFSWTVNSPVLGAVSGTGNVINATLINTSTTPQEVVYTVTPRALTGGCDGVPFKIRITVPVCLGISIKKAADRNYVSSAGDKINYTITVKNTGNANHTQVVVNDPLTGGVLSNPAGDNGNGILEKDESWIYQTSYTVTQADLDNNGAPSANIRKVQNVAMVQSAEVPLPSADVADVAIRQRPNIRLVKKGQLNNDYKTISYTFLITNKGNVTLRDLELTDPKIPGLVVSGPAVLAPGASTTVTANYTITEAEKKAGIVTNTATATGTYRTGDQVSDISGTNENNDDPTVIDVVRYPAAVDDFAKTKADVEVIVPVANNDRPSLFPLDVTTIEVKTKPLNGILQINKDGRIIYQPNKGYSGVEKFTYMINDENGLRSNIAVVTINVVPPDLEIPNTFTPNGDGKNDTFQIKGRENYDSIEISIFNRWGDEVYRSKNYKDEWDGAGLNEGTYFYVLKLKKGSNEESRKSWVLIKR